MKETNEAWRMLLESLEAKEQNIFDMKKREIELLQKLMRTEENVKELIKVISELQFPKKQPESLESKEAETDGEGTPTE